MTLTATPTPFTCDPGMHPRLDETVRHNLGDHEGWTAIRAAVAVQKARKLVGSLTGSVSLNIDDVDGLVAEVVLHSGDHTAYVREARTGWFLTVATFEDEDGDPYVRVVSSERDR